jgi:hypothetical protein
MKSGAVFFSCMALWGCGGGDDDDKPSFPDSQLCGLRIQVTGAFEAKLDGKDGGTTCSGHTIPGEITANFVPYDPLLSEFRMTIAGEKGVTGKQLPTRVSVSNLSNLWSTSNCTVDIFEYRFVETKDSVDQYRMVGSGRCTTPASNYDGTGDPLEIGGYEFVVGKWQF